MNWLPIGGVIDGYLFDVTASGSQDAPNILIYFKAFWYGWLAADGTSPRPSFRVQMKVWLEIKALVKMRNDRLVSWLWCVPLFISFLSYLNVLAFLPSRWQSESLEGDRTLEAHLDGRVLYTIIVSTLWGCQRASVGKVSLDLGNTSLSKEQSLSKYVLQHWS